MLDECKAAVAAQTIACEHLVGVDTDREGPSAIRNRLAASTDADWLLPLDDDDLLDPGYLKALQPHLDGADVVYPWCRVEGKPDWTPNRLYRPETLLRGNAIPVTSLIRRELWEQVGGWRRVEFEDYDFWRRCLGAGARFRCVPEVLWTYRIMESGTSRNYWDE